MVNPDAISFSDTEPEFGMSRPQLDIFNSRHHRHVRNRSPEGLAEVCSQLRYSLIMHLLTHAPLQIVEYIIH